MEQQAKRVPYGVSDFKSVIEQNQYYVDKTMFLPELEKQPNNLFFIRPRRFGKSIFLSMLYSYYDCNQEDCFETLFGSLWIGSHPTPLHGNTKCSFLISRRLPARLTCWRSGSMPIYLLNWTALYSSMLNITVKRRLRK